MAKKTIKEMTSSSGSGHYKTPLNLVPQIWKKDSMGAYTIPVSDYMSAELAYDSYDGKMSTPKKEIKKKEKMARKISKYIADNPTSSDEDGNILGLLYLDLSNVPIIEKLTETINISKAVFDLETPQFKNTLISAPSRHILAQYI